MEVHKTPYFTNEDKEMIKEMTQNSKIQTDSKNNGGGLQIPNNQNIHSDTNLPELSDMRKKEVSLSDITYDGVNGANPDHMPQNIEKATSNTSWLKIAIPTFVGILLVTIFVVSFVALNDSSDSDDSNSPEAFTTLDKVTRKVHFDIKIDDEVEEQVVFGLFGNTVPKTVRNFAELSSGINGKSAFTGNILSYKDTTFNQIITNYYAQGGDLLPSTGSSSTGPTSESIYNGQYFADENFKLSHSRPYLLSMDN